MSGTEKPKRRFWQFHLSTAVLLLLAAGGLLRFDFMMSDLRYGSMSGTYGKETFGWPIVIAFREVDFSKGDNSVPAIRREIIRRYSLHLMPEGVAAQVLILIAIFVFSEYLIRRREGRKT